MKVIGPILANDLLSVSESVSITSIPIPFWAGALMANTSRTRRGVKSSIGLNTRINRITNGVRNGDLWLFEVVEDGKGKYVEVPAAYTSTYPAGALLSKLAGKAELVMAPH